MVRSYSYHIDVYRNGAKFTELKAVSPPRIDGDAAAEIKTSMSGRFKYDPDVDWLNDELRPFQVIDGAEYPSGVFIPCTVSELYSDGTHEVDVEAYDRCFLLQSTRTENILHFSAGTSYLTAIKQLLTTAGIALYIETANDAVLSTAREDWSVGTDYLTIVNQLLAEINYQQIWFDVNGYAMLQPVVQPSVQRIKHRYSADSIRSVIHSDCTTQLDIYNQPNVFIAVCSNPDYDQPLTSVAVNDNPLSKLSVFKRRRRISQVYQVDNIASQAELDVYAQNLCNNSMLQSEVVTISTANMPNHGIGDIIAVDMENLSGLFQEDSWSMTLSPGASMSHKIRRQIIV